MEKVQNSLTKWLCFEQGSRWIRKWLRRFCEANHCLGVATGCDAWCGRWKDWELVEVMVITVANTFIGTVLPIIRVGADTGSGWLHPKTQQIDPDQVASAITPRTSAIVPVHLYGRLAPMDELLRLSDKMVWLFWKTRPNLKKPAIESGKYGHASGLAFILPKTLEHGAMEGQTSDCELYEKVKRFEITARKKYFHSRSWNSRLDSLRAIVLAEKLCCLINGTAPPQIASRYDILNDTEVSCTMKAPKTNPSITSL